MYPHERSLVTKLTGRPFVLLGVNSDRDRGALKGLLAEEGITWRSWWDEGRIDGPIHQQWQVLERPSIQLIDAKGVVRHRNIAEEDLDEAILKLVAEAEKAKKK